MNISFESVKNLWNSSASTSKISFVLNTVFLLFGIRTSIPDPHADWSWLAYPDRSGYVQGLMEISIVFLPMPILLSLLCFKKLSLFRLKDMPIIIGLSILPAVATIIIMAMMVWPIAIKAIVNFFSG